jgi:hypothetical protein
VQDGNPGFSEVTLNVALEADAAPGELQDLLDHAMALAPIPNTAARPVPVKARLV